MSALLQIDRLSKQYRRGGEAFFAVKEANLAVDAGRIVILTGKSGSGKSTLLNMLAGLLAPTSGSIVFDGIEITKLCDKDISQFRNEGIGYIPQGQSVLSNLTALENILLPFVLYHRGEAPPVTRAREILGLIDAAHLENARPEELSGGELRRVAIARSLINNPKLLIADEPTGNLDPETAADVLGLFAKITESGTGVILVTHSEAPIPFAITRKRMDGGVLCDI
jgi:putative ABC transport system ATP-binding protein